MESEISNFILNFVYVLVICAPLLLILSLTILKICKLEQRLNCNCICRRRRNNTIIVPLKKIEFYKENEYCNKTGNIIIIYPNNIKYIGFTN